MDPWPKLKCTFYEQSLVLQNQPYFSRFMEDEAEFRAATRQERLYFAAECRIWLGPPWAHRDTESFRAATRKERLYFAIEYGPDPYGRIRALEGPFFDPTIQNPI